MSSLRRSSSRLSTLNKDPTIEVGDEIIHTVTGGSGIVKFSGPTEFAGGHWIGVELDEPNGKNDGSVMDVRYFECREGHGIFVRAGQLKLKNGSWVLKFYNRLLLGNLVQG